MDLPWGPPSRFLTFASCLHVARPTLAVAAKGLLNSGFLSRLGRIALVTQ